MERSMTLTVLIEISVFSLCARNALPCPTPKTRCRNKWKKTGYIYKIFMTFSKGLLKLLRQKQWTNKLVVNV